MPLSDVFAAFRWWAILMALGVAATPLAFRLLGRLPDRGYAFVKMLGLLITSYLFWLLGSLGFLDNGTGGMLFALACLVGISGWVYWRGIGDGSPVSLGQWLRQNRRYVLAAELVFGLVFVLWVWVRAQNPAILHTEKPMEFAFLNAVGRSPTFPPLDPWLSGYAISYYYFGYVMTSVIARLAGVAEPLAFNLGIAWLTAGTAVAAFGLVYNLIAAEGRAGDQGSRGAEEQGEQGDWQTGRLADWQTAEDGTLRERKLADLQRYALVFGLVAALALPVAGNMQILMEILHANGYGSAEFWTWLDVRDINEPARSPDQPARYESSAWWWWRSSRVIHEYHLSGRAEEGLEPIAEFPSFSFILGDMHPHVLALPFAFLSLAVALAWWLRKNDEQPTTDDEWDRARLMERFGLLLRQVGLPLWALTALVLGGLSFLNTWDVLIHLFLILGAFVLGHWRASGRWHNRFLTQGAMMGFLLAVPAVFLYLPFYIGFRSQAGPPFLLPMLMRPTRLPHFLIIFGMPLWSILFLGGSLALRQRLQYWRVALLVAAGLIAGLLLLTFFLGWLVASSEDGAGRVIAIASELNLVLPPLPADTPVFYRLNWGLAAVLTLAPALLAARLQFAGLTLLLAILAGLAVALLADHLERREKRDGDRERERESSPAPLRPGGLPFVLLLVLTGSLLTLGPEFVYLRDNFGVRLNTVFKFYYQAWVMFGVAALFGLSYLLRQARVTGLVVTAGYSAMLAVALLFPVYMVSSRAAEYRILVGAEERQPLTLNGMAFREQTNPNEYAALMWLRENVAGIPIILEAVGGQYTEFGRVSASTGLPTVLGWAGHQSQWRGQTPEPGRRDPAVRTIYNQPGWDNTIDLLNEYQVAYIYVGPLERNSYDPQGLAKFDQSLEAAYRNGSVTIYKWQPR